MPAVSAGNRPLQTQVLKVTDGEIAQTLQQAMCELLQIHEDPSRSSFVKFEFGRLMHQIYIMVLGPSIQPCLSRSLAEVHASKSTPGGMCLLGGLPLWGRAPARTGEVWVINGHQQFVCFAMAAGTGGDRCSATMRWLEACGCLADNWRIGLGSAPGVWDSGGYLWWFMRCNAAQKFWAFSIEENHGARPLGCEKFLLFHLVSLISN